MPLARKAGSYWKEAILVDPVSATAPMRVPQSSTAATVMAGPMSRCRWAWRCGGGWRACVLFSRAPTGPEVRAAVPGSTDPAAPADPAAAARAETARAGLPRHRLPGAPGCAWRCWPIPPVEPG